MDVMTMKDVHQLIQTEFRSDGESRVERLIAFISAFNEELSILAGEALQTETKWRRWKQAVKDFDLFPGGNETSLWDSQLRRITHPLVTVTGSGLSSPLSTGTHPACAVSVCRARVCAAVFVRLWNDSTHYIPGKDPKSRWAQLRCSDDCDYRYFFKPNHNRADALTRAQYLSQDSMNSLTHPLSQSMPCEAMLTSLLCCCADMLSAGAVADHRAHNRSGPLGPRKEGATPEFDRLFPLPTLHLQLPVHVKTFSTAGSRAERHRERELKKAAEEEAQAERRQDTSLSSAATTPTSSDTTAPSWRTPAASRRRIPPSPHAESSDSDTEDSESNEEEPSAWWPEGTRPHLMRLPDHASPCDLHVIDSHACCVPLRCCRGWVSEILDKAPLGKTRDFWKAEAETTLFEGAFDSNPSVKELQRRRLVVLQLGQFEKNYRPGVKEAARRLVCDSDRTGQLREAAEKSDDHFFRALSRKQFGPLHDCQSPSHNSQR